MNGTHPGTPREYYIKGDRIGLCRRMPDDERLLYELWHDPVAQRNFNFNDLEESFEEFQQMLHDPARQAERVDASIVTLPDELFIGDISVLLDENNPNVAYLLHPNWRGKGYGTEALHLLLTYAFQTLRLEEVVAGAYQHNEPSLRMLIKAGFQRDPDRDSEDPNAWGPGTLTRLEFRLTREDWERLTR